MSKKVIVKQQSSQSPRTAVTFRSPIDFPTACIPVVLSYLFAYSHNLIHSYISSHPILPYRPQAPKNPTSNQARPAFPAPQTRHPPVFTNSLRRLPARYRMSRRSTNPTRPATGLRGFPATKGAALAMRCTTCTATSSGHIPAETSVRLEQIYAPNPPTQMPCGCVTPPQIKRQPTNSNPLGGMGMPSPRDAATTTQWGPAFKPARRPAPAAQGVDPRGIWTGWTRQKSADAAPDRAGRMADHAGRRPDPASCWRLGSQSPLPYFITYFLKRLVGFFVLPSGCRSSLPVMCLSFLGLQSTRPARHSSCQACRVSRRQASSRTPSSCIRLAVHLVLKAFQGCRLAVHLFLKAFPGFRVGLHGFRK